MSKSCSKDSHTNKVSQVNGINEEVQNICGSKVGFKTPKCPLDSLPQLVACRFHLQLFLALSVFFPFGKFEVFNTVDSGSSCSQDEPLYLFLFSERTSEEISRYISHSSVSLVRTNEFKRTPLFSIFSAILFH